MALKKIFSILLIPTATCFAMEKDNDTLLSTHGKLLPMIETPEVLSPIANFLDRHEVLTSTLVCKGWAKVFNKAIKGLKVAKGVTDADFIQLVERFPKITSLNLMHNNTISDEGVSKLTSLTNLNLRGNYKVTDEGVSNFTDLTSLNLNQNRKITDGAVSKLNKLTSLHLGKNNMITDNAVSQLTNLTRLNLRDNNTITEGAVTALKEHGVLKKVFGKK